MCAGLGGEETEAIVRGPAERPRRGSLGRGAGAKSAGWLEKFFAAMHFITWGSQVMIGPAVVAGPTRAGMAALDAARAALAAAKAGRAVRVGDYTLTSTVANHLGDVVKHEEFAGEMARPYLLSRQVLQEIMTAGKPVADPGGLAGALRWDVAGAFRGSAGTWEVVVQTESKTVVHWLFMANP